MALRSVESGGGQQQQDRRIRRPRAAGWDDTVGDTAGVGALRCQWTRTLRLAVDCPVLSWKQAVLQLLLLS